MAKFLLKGIVFVTFATIGLVHTNADVNARSFRYADSVELIFQDGDK